MLQRLLDRAQNIVKNVQDLKEPLGSVMGRKLKWSEGPLPVVQGSGPHHVLIQRCIALALALEVPVGHLALEGAEDMVDEKTLYDFKRALEANALDEVTHYRAFEFAAQAYSVPPEMVEEAQEFGHRALELDEHPVYIAGTLELSVFFVTLAMMRRYGSSPLKIVVNYVSRDEAAHVRTNYTIMDTLGIRATDKSVVSQLRRDILSWLTQEQDESAKRYWLKQSDSLWGSRKAPELEWTGKIGTVTAFLETGNRY